MDSIDHFLLNYDVKRHHYCIMHGRVIDIISLQVAIPADDTTYWCYATQLPQEVRDQQRYITRVRKLVKT